MRVDEHYLQVPGYLGGTISKGKSHEERRDAYACDICFGTNKQMVIDYLKDPLL